MSSQPHFEVCDFQHAMEQALLVQGSSFPSQTSYYECKHPNWTEYVSYSLPGLCGSRQKIKIHTSDAVYAFVKNRTDSQGENELIEWSIHVNFIYRVMKLLGARNNLTACFLSIDRGYQTEELAEQTLE